MVELERSGVRIDACRDCRGVYLDRGELDKIVAQERRVLEHDDQDDFIQEMTGRGGKPRESRYGFDAHTAERIFDDYRDHKHRHRKRRKSFLEELFD